MRNVHRLILTCAVLLLASTLSEAAEPKCSRTEIVQLGQTAKARQSGLLAVKVGTEDMGWTLAPSTQKLIRSLKDSLTAFTDAYMLCESSDRTDAQMIERALAKITRANLTPTNQSIAPADTKAEVDQVYGTNLRVSVKQPANRLGLMTVEWSFGECGNDSALLVYEFDHVWKRAVRWQSGDYNEINGAFGDFLQYAIVPRGSTGEWAFAVAHGHPWCTSRWSGFDLDVIAPAHNRSQQSAIFHQSYDYVRGDFDPIMKPTQHGFDLRLEVGLMDPDIMTRRGVYRFVTTGDKVGRIQPIAMNGRDFVDEWLNVKWADAERWSSNEHLSELRSEHDRIERRMQPGSKDYPSFSYGPVRGCSDDHNHFQVEANEDPGNPIFFQILQGNNSFTMLAASRAPDPRCKSSDVMRNR